MRRLLSDWILPILVAVALAVLLRAYVLEPRLIPSASMEPTLQIGDRVIVEKLFFHPSSLQRGDVIVFNQPYLKNLPDQAGYRTPRRYGVDHGRNCVRK